MEKFVNKAILWLKHRLQCVFFAEKVYLRLRGSSSHVLIPISGGIDSCVSAILVGKAMKNLLNEKKIKEGIIYLIHFKGKKESRIENIKQVYNILSDYGISVNIIFAKDDEDFRKRIVNELIEDVKRT